MVFTYRGSLKVGFKILLLTVVFSAIGHPVDRELPAQWVIWNVGQGSWLTRIEKNNCYHFDAGGDRRFLMEPIDLCRNKSNQLIISHTDRDHISYAKKMLRYLPDLCRFGPSAPSLRTIPNCKVAAKWWSWLSQSHSKNKNDRSGVFAFRDLLYPGDSPKKFEKFWLQDLPSRPRILVLAHHGSRTGTSENLLAQLDTVQMAIASARKNKYGHPHAEVQMKLKKANIPLLSTESWGNIHLLD